MSSGFIAEKDGYYMPATAELSAVGAGPSAPAAIPYEIDGYTHAGQSVAVEPPPTYDYNATVPLTYDINPIEQEPIETSTAPPTYDSLFGAAKQAVINRAMVTGRGIPTLRGFLPDADDGVGPGDAEVQPKPKKADKKEDEPDTLSDVITKFLLINILISPIPIAQIVLGIVNMDECPINDGKIQIYLIVNGAVFVFIGTRLWLPNQIDKCWLGDLLDYITGFSVLFLMAWFIVGSVWVFKVYNSVVYERQEFSEDKLMVTPYKKITGPFHSNKFHITTKEGTQSRFLRIYWNSDDDHTLDITRNINVCDADYYKNGNGTKMGGVWSFLVQDGLLRIWFNDELAVYMQQYVRRDCFLWDQDLKSMKLNGGAVTLNFDDYDLNRKLLGQQEYCNKTMYLFAFSMLLVVYIIIGLCFLFGCFALCA